MPKKVVTEESLPMILHLIDTWKGKLTWNLLCEEVQKHLDIKKVTRQALSSYADIQEAYDARKIELRNKKTVKSTPINTDLEYWQSQVDSLKAELTRANKTIEKFQQRFVLWQHNAYLNNININSLDDAIEMLEKPLSENKRRTGGK